MREMSIFFRRSPARRLTWHAPVLEALVVTALCAVLALLVNALRAEGLPLVQETEYQILVPCPETSGEVETLTGLNLTGAPTETLVLDARSRGAYESWHVPGARNVPYDYLEAVASATLRKLASSGAKRVVVYGDGENPDCGEHLAKELAGKGIRNVGFIVGGAPALTGDLPAGVRP